MTLSMLVSHWEVVGSRAVWEKASILDLGPTEDLHQSMKDSH